MILAGNWCDHLGEEITLNLILVAALFHQMMAEGRGSNISELESR